MGDLLDSASRLFALISQNTTSAVLTALGLLLVLIAVVVILSALKGAPPFWLKAVLFITLICGIGFSVAGPTLVLARFTENAIPRVASETALDRLEVNAFTEWLIRLIPYDPAKEPLLAGGRPNMLGLEWQAYAFVAPYEELRGLSVEKAVQRVGGKLENKQRLWAVIFQTPKENETVLYPANARGLLQVIRKIENDPKRQIEKPFLKGSNKLTPDDEAELDNTGIETWKFENFKSQYPKYCRLAHEFRCDPNFSAKRYMGGVNDDWHPLGFSRTPHLEPCKHPVDDFCRNADWPEWKRSLLSSGMFGSRAFLLSNTKIEALPKSYLIEFGEPSTQPIPDIGVR